MKKLFYPLPVFALLLLIQSCQPHNCVYPIFTSTKINFNRLQVGQTSLYVMYSTTDWRKNSDTTFKQTTDTIQLKVIEQNENGFKIEESALNKKRPTINCYFNVTADSLIVSGISSTSSIGSAFFKFDRRAFTLKEQGLSNWTTNTWLTPQNPTFGNNFGALENAVVKNVNYGKVMGSYDSTQSIFDGPAFTRYYSKNNGFINFQILGSMSAGGTSWYLIL